MVNGYGIFKEPNFNANENKWHSIRTMEVSRLVTVVRFRSVTVQFRTRGKAFYCKNLFATFTSILKQ